MTTSHTESAPQEWGLVCFNCKEQSPLRASEDEAQTAAAAEGWGMGHCDGQAHYTCDACSPLLFDVVKLRPVHHVSDEQAAAS